MLDIIGTISLALGAVLLVGTLAMVSAKGAQMRRRVAWVGALWFVAGVSLAALGVFSTPPPLGTALIGVAVIGPVVAGLIVLARSRSARTFALGIPLAVLVAVNAGRLLGVFFVVLHGAGRLPPTFALSAGWGDIVIGALSIPLAWAIHRRMAGWRSLTLVWNTLGIADLVSAVTLGIGSAAGSPLRFIYEQPDSSAITAFPWALIPGFFVPLYMLVHVAIFAQLAVRAPSVDAVPLGKHA